MKLPIFIRRMKEVKTYNVLGMMSGSSLDGLDMSHCSFDIAGSQGDESSFEIVNWKLGMSDCIPYNHEIKDVLAEIHLWNRAGIIEYHTKFGIVTGKMAKSFISDNRLEIDFISSHGHTVLHSPQDGLTIQIGDGVVMNEICGLPVIWDFRMADIAAGGQGAPIAPLADRFLFPGYDLYLNLGGIANISLNGESNWLAYDSCPCNQLLNSFSALLGLDYDPEGENARMGSIIEDVLQNWESNSFYDLTYPKTLDNGLIKKDFLSFLDSDHKAEDLLATASFHIAKRISSDVSLLLESRESNVKPGIFITGGGAYNSFLLEQLNLLLEDTCTLVVPENHIVDFKESALMSIMGIRRLFNLPNCFSTVTGAKKDTVGGIISGSLSLPT